MLRGNPVVPNIARAITFSLIYVKLYIRINCSDSAIQYKQTQSIPFIEIFWEYLITIFLKFQIYIDAWLSTQPETAGIKPARSFDF